MRMAYSIKNSNVPLKKSKKEEKKGELVRAGSNVFNL